MEAPRATENEQQRLQALYDSEILDTECEEIFDNLTKLVGTIFDVPIVAISLVDKNRQWFKSSKGLGVCETHRDVSFCGHAIHDTAPLVINDAREDERFHDNPLVTGEPQIAFYAGVPLNYGFDGSSYQIGTLCIIDTKPRILSTEKIDILKTFAKEVELLIEQRLERDSSIVANKAKSMFLANMSHELRTPIAGVIGILNVLKESNLDSDQKLKINMASDSANQLHNLVNDILDFSKIEADKLRLQKQEFSLSELFKDIVSSFEVLLKQAQNKLFLEYDWDEQTTVRSDPLRLKQVLNNLVSNANKFTQNGVIKIEASIEHVNEDKVKLICAVKDTGIGISHEDLSKLFQPFEQIENNSSRRFAGSGLGLIISQKICRLMRGDIEVNSTPGSGSCFKFHILLNKANEKVIPPEVEEMPKDFQSLNDCRVLLVEDDVTNRAILEHFLKKLRVNFDSYENGQEVCDILKANDPPQYDLVITDCQMPVIDGFQLTNMMRSGELGATFVDIPIIALTANALQGDREKCLTAGMSDYLSKPVSASELVNKINFWIANE